jgi:23S rRNA pseudouridine2605 synthase
MGEDRLHKILAHAGFGSRRECEKFILEGRVCIDGETVTELGVRIDPEQHTITCDGTRVKAEHKVYFLINKPRGYVCSNRDQGGQRIIAELYPRTPYRLYPVGRLDAESQGLMILTNDGELTNLLTHPRYEVRKTYLVQAHGVVSDEAVQDLLKGVRFSEGRAVAKSIKVLGRNRLTTLMEIVIAQGLNRQIRRMLAKVGHKVKRLTRTKIGHLTIEGLKSGRTRPLTRADLKPFFDHMEKFAEHQSDAKHKNDSEE